MDYRIVRIILKIVEVILCLIGLVLLEHTTVFFDRWTYEMLVLVFGGYFVICLNILFTVYMEEEFSELSDKVFMALGACLSLTAGIFTLMRYVKRDNTEKIWFYTSKLTRSMELPICIISLMLFIVFVADILSAKMINED
ncbi:uncharacterized protein LOC130900091 [Diorhabda carinulata]|uniref:uncharacterized protein LOC130900091 n=1 Tax=Diorhabda carinulata TaxID=1163345 RepID=UPI0025A2A25D|nr:uncharacterized protein LOC130900091 [Diorhabda carinulata]